jgi:hypothetical protein
MLILQYSDFDCDFLYRNDDEFFLIKFIGLGRAGFFEPKDS